ncbi:molybdenum cofactor guanylyltransferase MobA [Ferrimonas lipolytica]|uniref:Molybdenum cofactor guanylyltransferase n=1 Tax=Ferrimonas lipolytica TaxID=2724191 RepID=A0A6H1UIH5_9GAMM|nr:molybdenum cofactor guanylyltransferase MobA [Ferrimonas lipolytica]QIZ78016.1 molybdenum cofactor guanylyltransferase MobA [Ferrimonas lipolytica]
MTIANLTLAVLAGGQARRMLGEDKGLIAVAGKPMVQHVLQRLQAQPESTVLISNRNQAEYSKLGYPVFSDEIPDYAGPLAGVCSALQHSNTDYMLVVPCDTPMLPATLAEDMMATLIEHDAEIVIARDNERDHPVIMLLKCTLLDSLHEYLAGGDRKVALWYNKHKMAYCDFGDRAAAFANINTPEQKQQLEQQLLEQNT